MSKSVSEKYQYISAGNKKLAGKKIYICLQQSSLRLAWSIYHQDILFEHEGIVKKIWFSLFLAGRIIKNKLYFSRHQKLIELPFYGNLCFRVHRGYKVFDFHKNRTTKIFLEKVDAKTIDSEIQLVRKASTYNCAPKILAFSLQDKWYQEDYFAEPNINILRNNSFNKEEFYAYVLPCLQNLILSEKSKTIDLGNYLDEKRRVFLEHTSIDKKIAAQNKSFTSKLHRMQDFVDLHIKKLKAYREKEIYLVPSHGDFTERHVVKRYNDPKLIDWELLAFRSILYDFYTLFFDSIFHRKMKFSDHRGLDNTDLNFFAQMNEKVRDLESLLQEHNPEFKNQLSHLSQVYRWLYYIEKLSTFTGLSEQNLELWLRLIDTFNFYEENLSAKSNV